MYIYICIYVYVKVIVSAVQKELYLLYGRMLAYFVVHNGPAPQMFSKNLYTMMVQGLEEYKPTPLDVAPDLHPCLQQVNSVKSEVITVVLNIRRRLLCSE